MSNAEIRPRAFGKVAELIRRTTTKSLIAHHALRRITQNNTHHQQCILDNCRPACPIRIATEAMEAMTK